MAKVYLSLGSNLGDKTGNMLKAVAMLDRSGIRVMEMSSIYLTEPVGPRQPFFHNACVFAYTGLAPLALLEKIKTIEIQLGRKKNGKWAPRIIDIDILFYNNIILLKENLTIPHPEIEKRKFVLMPLCELAPGLRHPVTGMTVLAMKKSLISGKKALKLEFK